ncbi:ADR232Wp [Eremothecium gossypii ATCC 10895]|uniref:ADR232Wp n=1 Tax=Eremothecium gossypii (strain ATCC 10895 / CBS 109.51 / FGSC 9923 / NRRL Y-1056) TaxID=284811 RepID=Q759P3_EREGS|nr:ADR232Wp [Eremothecium gossypii ATCC 10895]AAS52152.1 ADR232Wp [Eremothecium gossypii ATCC 10895]AEY96451.1 FADR232Wp [Eremothecium gossypii FDAG1]
MSPYNVLNTSLNGSPFPQLKPHVRYRTAMERAGFDVAYGKFGGRPASKTSAASVTSRHGGSHGAPVGSPHGGSTSSLPTEKPINQSKPSGSADRTLPAAEGLGISASMPSLNTELVASPEPDSTAPADAFALPEIQVSYNHDQRSIATAKDMPSFVVPTPRNSLHSDTDRDSEYSAASEHATLPPYDAGADTGRFSQHFSPAAKRMSTAEVGSISTETRSFASSAERLSMYARNDLVSAPFQLMPTSAAPSVHPIEGAISLPISPDAHAKGQSLYSSATSDEHLGTHSTLDVDQKTTREPSIFDFENQKNSRAISQSNASSTYPTPAPDDTQEPVFSVLDPVERSFMMLTQNSQPDMEDKDEEDGQSLYSADDIRHSVNTVRTANSYQSASTSSHASSKRSPGVADRRQTRYSMMPKIQVSNSAMSLVSVVDEGVDIAPDPILQGSLGKKAEDASLRLSSGGSSEDENTVAAPQESNGLSSTTSQVERLIAQLDDVSLTRGDVDAFDSAAVPLPTSSLAAASHLPQTHLSNRAKKSSAYLSGIPDEVRNLPDLSIDPTLSTMTEHSSPESTVFSPDAQSPVMLSFKGRSLDEIWNPTKPAERLSLAAKRQSIAARNSAIRPVSTYGPNTIQPSQLTHVLSLEAAQRPRDPVPPAVPDHTPPLSPADSPTAWSLLDADSEIHTSPLRISAAKPKYPPGKGPCRSCGEKIKTKSIYSKREGELSGQWHRECFRCTVCALKFNKHVPCYILDDVIYCRQHYHEANNSICRVCRDFIEGECLENDKGETFHVSCLTCYLCHRLIQEDYYIYNDELPLCANHDMDALVRNGIHGERRSSDPDSLEVTNTLSKRRTRLINV